MLSRVKFVLPFAVAGILGLTVAGSQSVRAQGTTASTAGRTTSSSASSSTSSSPSSMTVTGLGSVGLGTTGPGSTGNVLGSTTSSSAIAGTSLFGPNIGEPLAYGNPSTYNATSPRTPTFGQPLYNTTSSSNTGGRGNTTGRTGTTGANTTGTGTIRSGSTGSTSGSFTSANAFRANAAGYTTQIKFAVPAGLTASAVQADLMQAIANATEIPSRKGVTVVMDGDMAILRGKVDTGEERRILESLVSMSQGVNKVRNEIEAQRPAE
jgi:hypothetical protein